MSRRRVPVTLCLPDELIAALRKKNISPSQFVNIALTDRKAAKDLLKARERSKLITEVSVSVERTILEKIDKDAKGAYNRSEIVRERIDDFLRRIAKSK